MIFPVGKKLFLSLKGILLGIFGAVNSIKNFKMLCFRNSLVIVLYVTSKNRTIVFELKKNECSTLVRCELQPIEKYLENDYLKKPQNAKNPMGDVHSFPTVVILEEAT